MFGKKDKKRIKGLEETIERLSERLWEVKNQNDITIYSTSSPDYYGGNFGETYTIRELVLALYEYLGVRPEKVEKVPEKIICVLKED